MNHRDASASNKTESFEIFTEMDEHNDFNEEMLLKEEERMVAYALVKEREVEVCSDLL